MCRRTTGRLSDLGLRLATIQGVAPPLIASSVVTSTAVCRASRGALLGVAAQINTALGWDCSLSPEVNRSTFPLDVAAISIAYMSAVIEDGLKSLGLYGDTDEGVLHKLSAALPDGHFDGHRSVLPAPDHLLLHGLAKKVVCATMFMIPKEQRATAEMSLRDCLRAAHMRRTRVYNIVSGKMYSPSISEWAAVTTVAPIAFARVLQRPSDPSVPQPLLLALRLLRQLSDLTVYAYHFPRAELDGVAACRARKVPGGLSTKVDTFLEAVTAVCLRNDCVVLRTAIDVPNLHRLRELAAVVEGGLGHVRHFMELALESAHQPMKRAMVNGNGHDDAGRAMRRMQQAEMVSRIATDASFFNLPQSWTSSPGISDALLCSPLLHSLPSGSWRVCGSIMDPAHLPLEARALAAQFRPEQAHCVWSTRVSRGNGQSLSTGDTVCVLTSGAAGRMCVNVAGVRRGTAQTVAFFFIVGVFSGTSGPNAIVSPYESNGESGVFRLAVGVYKFLKLHDTVRRALALHRCGENCFKSMDECGMRHNSDNAWYLIGRREGYPFRSG